MSVEADKFHFACGQADDKENEDPFQHRTKHSPYRINLALSPVSFPIGSLADDDETMQGSVSVSEFVKATKKKTCMQAKKFFYPRFKRRAYGFVTAGYLQCCVNRENESENSLCSVGVSAAWPRVAAGEEHAQQTNGENRFHGLRTELSIMDIANCESPANLLQQANEKNFLERSCDATPMPINRNLALRLLHSPCSEGFPVLSFASLEKQQDKHSEPPSLFGPSPSSGRLSNGRNEAESGFAEDAVLLDARDKEEYPGLSMSNSKAILVYRSLQKTKKRRKFRSVQNPPLTQGSDVHPKIFTARSCAGLDMIINDKPVGLGPVLRSSNSKQMHQNKITQKKRLPAYASKKFLVKSLLEKYIWSKRLKHGTPSRRETCLQFLSGKAARRVECFYCKAYVAPKDLISCSYKGCLNVYHLTCGQSLEGFNFRKNGTAVCPQHVCIVCKRQNKLKVLKCQRCTVAAHKKCFAFPDHATFLESKPCSFICWRHPKDWRFDNQYRMPTLDTKEAFERLPLPYAQAEFSIQSDIYNEVFGNILEPTPFVHIRRNIFLVKKKRDHFDDGVGCTCRDMCQENCECRAQSMSCSKSCTCHEKCGNKPFRREKRIKLIKTMACGWGVQTTEAIVKGEFIIEYVGEVINEAMCEARLWTLKERGDHNFYMCEIGKNFIIDATFKGNASRFINHSCDPNCKLEKWRVEGEIRVGIFALQNIKEGEALTYDYRFVQFGPSVRCQCGSSNCRGNLGEAYRHQRTKQVPSCPHKFPIWGSKHRRSQKHLHSNLIAMT